MTMKRWSIGLGAVVLIAAVPLMNSAPVMASLQQAGEAIAQTLRRPDVRLNLSAEKQVIVKELSGQTKTSWKSLAGKVAVQPGDILRYTVSGKNAGQRGAKDLAITQPIPKQMSYVLNSAVNSNSAQTVYSIDNGRTFVENPTIQVTLADGKVETRPAPAEAYTHVRWQFASTINPDAAVQAAYQAQVR